MPDHWKETTLGEVVVLKPGKYIAKDSYVVDGKYWIYGSNSVMGRYSDALVQEPHIVMAAIGAYAGAVRHSEDPSWVNNNAFALIPKSQLLSMWLFYWLESFLEISSVVVGTGQPYVQRPALMNQVFHLPPIEEQRRIVDLVGSIDTYIDSLETQIETTRTARSALLSELLSNPGDDWQETTLGDVASWTSGKSLPASNRKEDGLFPVLGASGEISRTDDWLMDCDAVLVGRVGAVGAIQRTSGRVWVSDNALIAQPTPFVDVDFLQVLLECFDFTPIVSGNAQPVITQGRLKSQVVSIPSLVEQRRIVNLVGSFDEQISSLESQVESVRALRSGVLSELLSGERLLDESYDMAGGL